MDTVGDVARELGARAESFCRAYLPNGRMAGAYWQVGDVTGAAGSSLAVRLTATDNRPPGKWRDFATGEAGDLLDLIPYVTAAASFADVMREARSFLGRPDLRRLEPLPSSTIKARTPSGAVKAERLWSMGQEARGSLAETYLSNRDITRLGPALRFHPGCYYRDEADGELRSHPAMLARITDDRGTLTGVARTWLDAERGTVADIASPKRVMGNLLGNAVRFGAPGPVLAAGEGIETMLSVGTALPRLSLAACLTATHLGLFEVPDGVRELWICRDNDEAGERASRLLHERYAGSDLLIRDIEPVLGDFNDDLTTWGADAMTTRFVADYGDCVRRFAGGGWPETRKKA